MLVQESQATTVAARSPQQSESDTESVGHNCMVGAPPRRRLRLQEVVPFHGGQTEPSHALRQGWVALREVFRNWGVRTREDLTNRLGTRGHPWSHLATRTQEFIPSAVCGRLLEALFVAIVIDMGRAIAVLSCPHPVSRVPMTTRRGQVLVPRDHSRVLGPIGPGGPSCASPDAEELPSFLARTFEVLFLQRPAEKDSEDGE